MKPALIVHGGCGPVPEHDFKERTQACENAAEAGWAVIKKGGSALEAVQAAVCALEDAPVLNAGTGSYLQADGVARMDASIMSSSGQAGAAAQVVNIKNPIKLARYLHDEDAHILLCGSEATQLALRIGIEPAVVATQSKVQYWQTHLSEESRRLDYAGMARDWRSRNARDAGTKGTGGNVPRLGTVGCVAVDRSGQLAAGTSTGGTGQSYPGRIGDTPIIGAGTYATAWGACSMTGVGERVMVHLSAKRLCDLVESGKSLIDAGNQVLAELEKIGGHAGLIGVDRAGNLVALKNTAFMAAAERS